VRANVARFPEACGFLSRIKSALHYVVNGDVTPVEVRLIAQLSPDIRCRNRARGSAGRSRWDANAEKRPIIGFDIPLRGTRSASFIPSCSGIAVNKFGGGLSLGSGGGSLPPISVPPGRSVPYPTCSAQVSPHYAQPFLRSSSDRVLTFHGNFVDTPRRPKHPDLRIGDNSKVRIFGNKSL
jgi:hypothetical protein